MKVKFFLIALVFFSFQQNEIGQKIWRNECGAKREGLTVWNAGEEFASMGIGHFIWYPEGKRGPYQETFPDMIAFLEKNGKEVPNWLKRSCPWRSKQEFNLAFESQRMKELRQLLVGTIDLQTAFIIKRFETSSLGLHPQAKSLLKESGGVFALIDYLNFKGEGTSEKERYQGVGWGLKQVLDSMRGQGKPLEEFVFAAKQLLRQRVANAPPERNELRWLAGWENRLDGYLEYENLKNLSG